MELNFQHLSPNFPKSLHNQKRETALLRQPHYFTDWYFFTCISFFLSNDIQLHRGAVGEAEEQH